MKFGYTSRLSIFGLEMECEIKVLVWIYIRKTVFLVWIYIRKNGIFGLEMLYFYLFSFGLLKISCIFAACFKR